jgi:sorbitol-specific phosphotransferase system component IIBC
MWFKKDLIKQSALFLCNAVKVFIYKLALLLGKSICNAVKVFIHKLGLFPWKSIPKKAMSFCKKTISSVIQKIIFLVKRTWPVIKTILPSLVTGALIFAAMNSSGLVRAMIDDLVPAMGFVPAVLLILVISLIPVVSPLVGPGLIIAVLAVIATGEQIAARAVTPLMALPAFCAIDALIGSKIIPHAFAVGETEPETINAGVPVVFFTRLITIPAAVATAYLFSFILFQS